MGFAANQTLYLLPPHNLLFLYLYCSYSNLSFVPFSLQNYTHFTKEPFKRSYFSNNNFIYFTTKNVNAITTIMI